MQEPRHAAGIGQFWLERCGCSTQRVQTWHSLPVATPVHVVSVEQFPQGGAQASETNVAACVCGQQEPQQQR